MNLTEKEKVILKAGNHDSLDYSFCYDYIWTYDLIDCSELKPEIAKGVLSSLVKKELIFIEQDGRYPCVMTTQEGKKVCQELGYID